MEDPWQARLRELYPREVECDACGERRATHPPEAPKWCAECLREHPDRIARREAQAREAEKVRRERALVEERCKAEAGQVTCVLCRERKATQPCGNPYEPFACFVCERTRVDQYQAILELRKRESELKREMLHEPLLQRVKQELRLGVSPVPAEVSKQDAALIRLWARNDMTDSAIAYQLRSATKTIRNRIGELRRKHGESVVPYRRKPRKIG